MRLPELQNSFTHGILHGPEPRLLAGIIDDTLSAKDRFAAYTNNVYVGLFETLKTFFPTVLNIGSEDFFRGVVRGYVKAHPPQHGILDDYGQNLPAFLERYAPASTLPYLPDIARLDWALHEVDIAQNDKPLKREVLQARMDTLADSRIPLRQAVRLFTSKHPLKEIWHFCQAPDREKPVNMLQRQRHYIAYRCDDYSSWFEEIPSSTFTGLKGLMTGQTLQQALSNASVVDAQFDASAFLLYLMSRELIRE